MFIIINYNKHPPAPHPPPYINMILSYNWQILERQIADQKELQLQTKHHQPLPEDSFNSQQSPNISLNPSSLKSPNFAFLFCYSIEQPKNNPPQIELLPDITLCDQSVSFKISRTLRTKTSIYLQLQIQNSEIYDNIMTLTVKIRYHSQDKLPKIHSIDQLVRLAAQRRINLYTATTYSTIKRDIVLESPVTAEWRQEKEGYLYLKLSRPQDAPAPVEILEVEVMNWLANNPNIRKQVARNLLKGPFLLKPKESFGFVFNTQSSLIGEEIPFYIIYRLSPASHSHKMVKYISLFEYK